MPEGERGWAGRAVITQSTFDKVPAQWFGEFGIEGSGVPKNRLSTVQLPP